ncbi:MAG: cytochrome c peroxidase [Pseudomonadota bacterium]
MLRTVRVAMVWLALCGAGAARGQALPNEPLRPLPLAGSFDPARAALGRALFHDLRLSRDNTHSCASCHQLKHGGADGKSLSAGAGGLLNRFNTPTVYNSSFNFRQTWTGRHSTIDGLLEHVVSRPSVLATTWDLVATRLAGDADISARFQRVYGDDVAAPLVKDALGQYLASLVTPSRFDRYLRGDSNAISADEKAGYAKFKGFGCVACHQGINVGGNMYQKFGAMRELSPGAPAGQDPGRFDVTGREADRHMFRVPSLRNVALTAPYFHNGSVATLEEAVDAMFKYQLGRNASAQDKEQIIRFLGSLSGEKMPPAGALP